ncbi:TPA: DoxX family membrane protein [Corynebacterium striatum]|nr:DoxX family membrane protein [Corynebacterium striatum]
MSDKNVPDKATSFDDDLDLPTYSRDKAAADAAADNADAATEVTPAAAPTRSRLFQRPGRAEPQEIKPKEPKVHDSEPAETASVESEPTEVFASASEADSTVASQAVQAPENGHKEGEGLSFDSSRKHSQAAPVAAPAGEPIAEDAEPAAKTKQFVAPRDEEPAVAEDRAEDSSYDDADFAPTAVAAAAPAAATTVMPASVSDVDLEAETEEEKSDRLKAEQAERDGYREYGRRGTIDFGLLFVRIALSAYLLLAGATTFFKLGGGEGLSGLESEFANYAFASPLAIAVPAMQLIAGAFLLLGLVTPLAAMVGLVVTGFMALHELAASGAGVDVFTWPESVWLSSVLFAIAIALQFTGPGFISFDVKRSWARRPLATSWIFVIVGIAVLVALWWFGAGVNPIA